jgi:radical SAM-linked protein
MMRVRVRFSKRGKVRWTSHRDTARMWERAMRRAEVPVAYTEGFSPRPKVSFGLALPTGCESVSEYLDVELSRPVEVRGLAERLSRCLPRGVDAMAAVEVAAGEPSLQEAVGSCSWLVEVHGMRASTMEAAVGAALGAASIPVVRERKGRLVEDDIRPAVVALRVSGETEDGVALDTELATRPRGVRPAELVVGIARLSGADVELRSALRTSQWIDSDGARREPIPFGATDAPHALERVS